MANGHSVLADQIDHDLVATLRKRAIPASIQFGEILETEKILGLHAFCFRIRVAGDFFVLGIPSHNLAFPRVEVKHARGALENGIGQLTFAVEFVFPVLKIAG